MRNKKIIQLIIHSLPLLLGIVLSYLLWESSILLLGVYIVAVALLIIAGKDKKVELWILLYGMIAGFVVEVIGTQVSGYQSFTNPDMWGIPYWLIVTWGYGFLLMKRVSLIIATGFPWVNR